MTNNRSRFCVLFRGTEEKHPVKTRLLYNDSSKEDINEIWSQIYEEAAPADAGLIIGENCVYRLDDNDDLVAFLAQAEDQYKLLPSRPLKVVLGSATEYFRQRRNTPELNGGCESMTRSSSPQVKGRSSQISSPTGHDRATDLTTKHQPSNDVNTNNNNRHREDIGDREGEDSPKEFFKEVKSEKTSWPGAGSNALLNLYNSYRGEGGQNQLSNWQSNNYHKSVEHSTLKYNSKTIGGVIDNLTRASSLHKSPMGNSEYKSSQQENEAALFENPYLAYTKQMTQALTNGAGDLTKKYPGNAGFVENGGQDSLAKPPFNLSAYSAIVNSLQEQRLMQSNPSASYILQTIFNNHMKGNMQNTDSQNGLPDARMGASHFLEQKNNLPHQFMSPQMVMTPPNNATLSRSFPDARSSSLFSSLAHHNSNSLLSYMKGNDETPTTKKKKRRRMLNNDDKPTDTTKRMRSSNSQSNIEYHYQRAIDYSQMAEDEQKLQNSAHRSHWKHLLFVAEISKTFLEKFKHAKYDEWSSEARDIFAICQPDKYMWSFLTLSKQGDMLCTRIIGRIDDLIALSPQDKPEWCPPEEVLLRAQTRAKERLSQLQRILYSRSINQENAKNEEKRKEINKLSAQEKNLALVTAYHQRQQEILQNHQALIKQTASYHSLQQNLQDQQRSSVIASSNGLSHCSSLTSSPVSMASPAFEENSGGSRCSDSPTPRQEIDAHNEGNLVIAEQDHSPDSLGTRSISPQPFIQTKIHTVHTSPHKWPKIEHHAVDV